MYAPPKILQFDYIKYDTEGNTKSKETIRSPCFYCLNVDLV